MRHRQRRPQRLCPWAQSRRRADFTQAAVVADRPPQIAGYPSPGRPPATPRDFIANNAQLILAEGGFLIGVAFGAVAHRQATAPWGRSPTSTTSATTAVCRAACSWRRRLHVADGGCGPARAVHVPGAAAGTGWAASPAAHLRRRHGARRRMPEPTCACGGGDLRALLAMVVLGLVSYMTIGGLVAPARGSEKHPR